MTDNELGSGGNYTVPENWRAGLVQFLDGVDTLIHDGMYSDELMALRAGWGHSTPKQAVELAAECRARHLVLFHHEPEHDDAAIDKLLARARADAKNLAPRLTVDAASEGMQLNL